MRVIAKNEAIPAQDNQLSGIISNCKSHKLFHHNYTILFDLRSIEIASFFAMTAVGFFGLLVLISCYLY